MLPISRSDPPDPDTEDAAIHPDFEAEQEYIEDAHRVLEQAQVKARDLHTMVESGRGGTHQARFERDVIHEQVNNRVAQLDIGDASLVFGRLDLADERAGETFYIGRVAVWDDTQEPITVDWRAPVAEPFYRATGRAPMGVGRRRHFATRGRTLLGVEDEYFGDGKGDEADGEAHLKGAQTLAITMEQARTGRLGDIVATIQAEQDEIIRSELPGILVVQGGPGTGKTVVALHRAAYLLYTHRFPLEGQGVLVIGPNRLFLTYIEQVLPSLGEAGVQLVVLSDLVPRARVRGFDGEAVARVKGDPAMSHVLRAAVRDRERPLREDLVVGYGLQRLRFTVEQSRELVTEARRRFNKHNGARRFVRERFFEELATSGRDELSPNEVESRLKTDRTVRGALDWMWPVLTPEHLLHDLYGSKALTHSASSGHLSKADRLLLHRPRASHVSQVVWTAHDVPLLDEARAVLGPRPRHKAADEIRTYGHIVVDEAQDLSPMQLRMLKRRSLNGSMTLVGDIAQATGAWAHDDWTSVLEDLPQRREPRFAELTVGYRLPQPTMDVAARVLRFADLGLEPPTAVRREGSPPRFVHVDTPARLGATVTALIEPELEAIGPGNLAVIAPDALVDQLSDSLTAAGVDHGRIYEGGLDGRVTIVPVGLVKGLELDAAIVVEPARIVRDERNGLRSLYVALTRATRRLAIVHAEPLPTALLEPVALGAG
ncbi:MAG: UvrD-helicase domain-containing protein [Actinomycetota bacterium]